MRTRTRTLALLASVAAAAVATGCGKDDGGKRPTSIAEAKATLSKDCQDGRSSDKKLCDCVAAKLEAGGKTARQILDLNEQVKKGKLPTEVTTALTTCTKETAG